MFKKIFSIISLVLVLASCGTDRTPEQKVSAMMSEINSPFFVANMNLQNLMDKSEIMKEGTLPFTYMEILGFFLEADVTGIDYATNTQIIVGEGSSFTPSIYGVFKIGDQEKFKELIETEAGAEIKEKEGYSYAIKESEHYCVVWKEDFAMISDIPIDLASLFSGGGKEGEKKVTANIRIMKAAEEGEIDAEWESFFMNDADISMRYEGAGFYSYMDAMSFEESDEEMEQLKELYEGTNSDVFINFVDGAVEVEMVANLSEVLKKKLSFVPENGVSEKMLEFGKTNEPMMVGAYNIEAAGAMDYFKDISPYEYDKMMEDAEEAGISVDDLKKSMSGQIVYMVEEVVMKNEVVDFGYGESFEVKSTDPIFAVVLGLDDKSYIENKFNEVIAAQMAGEQIEGMEDAPEIEVWENGVVKIGDAMVLLGEDFLFASNDTTWANMIANGDRNKVSNPEGVLNAKPIGLLMDLTQVSKMANSVDLPVEYAKMIENMSLSANLQGGNIVINMVDKSQNALKVLTVTVGNALSDFEKSMNPEMESELEEAFQETQNAFDELEDDINDAIEDIDLNEVEDALNSAFDELNN